MDADGTESDFESAPPDFYLASMEGYDLQVPRACWRIRQLGSARRNDFLLIRVEPPAIVDNLPRDRVVVASRHVGDSVLSISDWPIHVHVALAPDGCEITGFMKQEDLHAFAWAELYRTAEDAQRQMDESFVGRRKPTG